MIQELAISIFDIFKMFFIALATLKCTGLIDYTWMQVFTPLFIGLGIVIAFCIVDCFIEVFKERR